MFAVGPITLYFAGVRVSNYLLTQVTVCSVSGKGRPSKKIRFAVNPFTKGAFLVRHLVGGYAKVKPPKSAMFSPKVKCPLREPPEGAVAIVLRCQGLR